MTQQARPLSEQMMPDWQRDALDRQRDLLTKNSIDNPAIMAELHDISTRVGNLEKLVAMLLRHDNDR